MHKQLCVLMMMPQSITTRVSLCRLRGFQNPPTRTAGRSPPYDVCTRDTRPAAAQYLRLLGLILSENNLAGSSPRPRVHRSFAGNMRALHALAY